MIASATSLLLSLVAFSDVSFTGAVDNDLSREENWSATPTAADVATIDLASREGAFSLGGSLAVKGLVFANGAGKTVSLSGAGTLSLGASGLSFSAAATSFALSAPVTLTAAQTWSLGATPTDFRSAVGGSVDWTVDATGVVRIYKLGYDGFVNYTGAKGQVRFLGTTDWANKVRLTATGVSVIALTNTVEWSSIFTGSDHTLELADFGNVYVCQPTATDAGSVGQPGRLIFREGDAITFMEAFGVRNKTLWVAQGVLDQRGGSIVGCDRYQPTIGGNATTRGYNAQTSSIAGYELSGGTFTGSFLTLGGSGSQPADTGNDMKIVQTGGTLTARTGLWLVDGGYSVGVRGISEYILGGGVLNVGDNNYGGYNNAQTRDLVVAGSHDTNVDTAYNKPAGVLTMTNGTLKARHVRFGVDASEQGYKNNDSFGLFDMRGGEMPLNVAINGTNTKTLGFDFGKFWNVDGSAKRSFYRLNLGGGTISVASGDWINRFGFFFPARVGSVFTWDTGDGDTTFAAPISGSGTLRKEGAGKLTIVDGSCFDGTLDVAEGKLALPGAMGADDLSYACYKWTADSLAGMVEGATVSSWADDSQGLNAGVNSMVGGGKTWSLPTFVSSSAYFNGHAALAFTKANGMPASLAAESNPLAGKKVGTIVAVFRRTAGGKDGTSAFAFPAVCGVGGSWGGTMLRLGATVGDDTAKSQPYAYLGMKISSGTSIYQNDYCLVTNPIKDATGSDAPCHVMIATLDNGRYTVFSDGQYNVASNEYWHAKAAIASDRNFFFGGFCSDGSSNSGTDIEIAEVRVYPDRALTLAEQRQLGSRLFVKYRCVGADEAPEDLWYGPYCGSIETGSETAPEKPAGGTSWNAAALNALDAATGCNKPTLVAKAFGGEDAMRFDGSSALAIPAAQSPLSGATAFTMAVVFRTQDDGATGLDTEMTGHVGLVSSRPGTKYTWDAILALYKECSIGVEVGNAKNGYRFRRVDRRPCRLNDGHPHVAVFSVTPTAYTGFTTMVDGRYNYALNNVTGLGNDAWPAAQAHPSTDVYVGAEGALSQLGFFKGDIAEVVLYGKQLNEAEMTALSQNLAAKYRFRLLPQSSFADADVTARGLRASNLLVRAGAQLTMPLSATGAYALAAGATLSGAGTMLGSYAFGNGARLDLASATPAALSDVQVSDGGIIRIDVTNPYEFENFSASGTVNVELVNYDAATVPTRVELFSFRNAPSIAPGTTWVFPGHRNCTFKFQDGKLVLCTSRGMTVIIR